MTADLSSPGTPPEPTHRSTDGRLLDWLFREEVQQQPIPDYDHLPPAPLAPSSAPAGTPMLEQEQDEGKTSKSEAALPSQLESSSRRDATGAPPTPALLCGPFAGVPCSFPDRCTGTSCVRAGKETPPPRYDWKERIAHHARVNPTGEDREGYRPDDDCESLAAPTGAAPRCGWPAEPCGCPTGAAAPTRRCRHCGQQCGTGPDAAHPEYECDVDDVTADHMIGLSGDRTIPRAALPAGRAPARAGTTPQHEQNQGETENDQPQEPKPERESPSRIWLAPTIEQATILARLRSTIAGDVVCVRAWSRAFAERAVRLLVRWR